jgi:hypothetical protein
VAWIETVAKCPLGPKKLRKIQRFIGPEYSVHGAWVRGGWTHYWASAFIRNLETGAQPVVWINYKTGEIDWPEPGKPLSTWTT